MIYISKLISPISTGTSAGDIDVGATVKINENGDPVDYLIVNQGLPSDIYDASCEGTWCLRKDIAENRQWNSSSRNSYKASTIHTYLNGTFLNLFDSDIREVIKQVKIPYVNGTADAAVASGANGLSCKIFLLSGKEVGWDSSDNQNFPNDGAKLSYFLDGTGSSANQKRVATLNGSATGWWLRSPLTGGANGVWGANSGGNRNGWDAGSSYGVRPALILPYSFKFKEVS